MPYECGLIPPIQSALITESLIPAYETTRVIERRLPLDRFDRFDPFDPFGPFDPFDHRDRFDRFDRFPVEVVRESILEPPFIEEHIEYEGPPYEYCRPLYRGWPHDHYETSTADHGHRCPEVHHVVHNVHSTCCRNKCRNQCDDKSRDKSRKLKPLRIGGKKDKARKIAKAKAKAKTESKTESKTVKVVKVIRSRAPKKNNRLRRVSL